MRSCRRGKVVACGKRDLHLVYQKRGQLRYCLQQTLVHEEKCKDTRPDEEAYPGLPPSSMLVPDTLCKAKAGSHGVWGEG